MIWLMGIVTLLLITTHEPPSPRPKGDVYFHKLKTSKRPSWYRKTTADRNPLLFVEASV